jgi:hypothetical protein
MRKPCRATPPRELEAREAGGRPAALQRARTLAASQWLSDHPPAGLLLLQAVGSGMDSHWIGKRGGNVGHQARRMAVEGKRFQKKLDSSRGLPADCV